MKKLSLLPTFIVLVIGGVFAATQLLPENPEFPSMPKQEGTLGYALTHWFSDDGTAHNTERLGGLTASGYLQNNTCIALQVWTGIGADGKAICSTRGKLLVGTFTEVSEGVKLIKPDHTEITPVIRVTQIEEGDLVQTNDGTGTIQFAQDASYIRLDKGTTVEIRTGQLEGRTVAEAILADGQLWGRILTNTGVNLGGGGLVAGVRGTSVAVRKVGTNVSIAIVDSRNTGNNAATIRRADGMILQTVGSGTLLVFASGATPTPTITRPTKTALLTTIGDGKWIRDNTLEDIERLHTLSGALVANASGELTSTLSGTNTPAVATALCSSTTSMAGTSSANSTKVFWPSLVGTVHAHCQNSNIIAFADYTKTPQDKKMYLKSGIIITLDNQNNYTLPSTLSNYSIYAFGPLQTNLAVEVQTNLNDPEFEAETIKNNENHGIGTKLKWNINTLTNRLEVK